jgi:Sec-independent protein secretion pathway component TatC
MDKAAKIHRKEKVRGMRRIVMGVLVMAAAFTLHDPLLQALQFIMGTALFTLGLVERAPRAPEGVKRP